MFVSGLVLLCISTMLFSLLSLTQDVTIFLASAYTLRLAEGVAGAILWPAMLAPILRRYCLIPFVTHSSLNQSFPKNSGLVYSVMDATFCVGYMLGPVLGAFLYQAGGFIAPFLVCGAAISVSCPTSLLLDIYTLNLVRWLAVCAYLRVS